jgi:hypothetical protein
MATAELAACLPVLVLLLAAAIGAITVADARVRALDAAREAARAAARGDPHAAAVAGRAEPGADVHLRTSSDEVTATAVVRAHLAVPFLPGVTVSETVVAAMEPR